MLAFGGPDCSTEQHDSLHTPSWFHPSHNFDGMFGNVTTLHPLLDPIMS